MPSDSLDRNASKRFEAAASHSITCSKEPSAVASSSRNFKAIAEKPAPSTKTAPAPLRKACQNTFRGQFVGTSTVYL